MAGFTAIASGIGLALSAGQTLGSGAQAAKLKKEQKRAQRASSRAMAQARNLLTRNVAEEARLRTFAFDESLRRQQALTAQSVDALQSAGARGVLGGIQAVQAQATEQQMNIMAGMEQQEIAREQAILKQEQANIDALGEIEIAEAQGASAAAIQAGTARAKAISDSLSGLASLGTQGADFTRLEASTRQERLGTKAFQEFQNDPKSMASILGNQIFEMTDEERLEAFQALPNRQLRDLLKFGAPSITSPYDVTGATTIDIAGSSGMILPGTLQETPSFLE